MTIASDRLTVLIAEHRPLFCEGLASVINREPDMLVVGAISDTTDLAEADTKADVVVIGHDPPHLDGIRLTAEFGDRFAPIILLDRSQGGEAVSSAVRAGARGILYVDAPHILPSAIRTVVRESVAISISAMKLLVDQFLAAARPPNRQDTWLMLSRREAEVLQHIAVGMGNREIAARLSITVATVKSHIYSACRKLGVQGRTNAAIMAYQAGMVGSGDSAGSRSRSDRG